MLENVSRRCIEVQTGRSRHRGSGSDSTAGRHVLLQSCEELVNKWFCLWQRRSRNKEERPTCQQKWGLTAGCFFETTATDEWNHCSTPHLSVLTASYSLHAHSEMSPHMDSILRRAVRIGARARPCRLPPSNASLRFHRQNRLSHHKICCAEEPGCHSLLRRKRTATRCCAAGCLGSFEVPAQTTCHLPRPAPCRWPPRVARPFN